MRINEKLCAHKSQSHEGMRNYARLFLNMRQDGGERFYGDMDMKNAELMTSHELARWLKVKPETVKRLICPGFLVRVL